MSMPEISRQDQSFEDVLSEVVESIASEENALSRMIEAETEKLRFAVDYIKRGDGDIQKLIEVNKSAAALLQQINDMQLILKNKLSIAVSRIPAAGGEQAGQPPALPAPPASVCAQCGREPCECTACGPGEASEYEPYRCVTCGSTPCQCEQRGCVTCAPKPCGCEACAPEPFIPALFGYAPAESACEACAPEPCAPAPCGCGPGESAREACAPKPCGCATCQCEACNAKRNANGPCGCEKCKRAQGNPVPFNQGPFNPGQFNPEMLMSMLQGQFQSPLFGMKDMLRGFNDPWYTIMRALWCRRR